MKLHTGLCHFSQWHVPTSPADQHVLGTCMAKHDALWGLRITANLKLQ